jgi:hypothetical protein
MSVSFSLHSWNATYGSLTSLLNLDSGQLPVTLPMVSVTTLTTQFIIGLNPNSPALKLPGSIVIRLPLSCVSMLRKAEYPPVRGFDQFLCQLIQALELPRRSNPIRGLVFRDGNAKYRLVKPIYRAPNGLGSSSALNLSTPLTNLPGAPFVIHEHKRRGSERH